MFIFGLGLFIGLAVGILTKQLAFREYARLHPPTATLSVTRDSLRVPTLYEDRQ